MNAKPLASMAPSLLAPVTHDRKSLAVKEIIGKIQTAIGQIYSNSTKSPTAVEETLGPSDEEVCAHTARSICDR